MAGLDSLRLGAYAQARGKEPAAVQENSSLFSLRFCRDVDRLGPALCVNSAGEHTTIHESIINSASVASDAALKTCRILVIRISRSGLRRSGTLDFVSHFPLFRLRTAHCASTFIFIYGYTRPFTLQLLSFEPESDSFSSARFRQFHLVLCLCRLFQLHPSNTVSPVLKSSYAPLHSGGVGA